MYRREISLIGGIVLLLALVVSPVLAQGGNIAYGDNTAGSLSADAPLAFYTFSGAAGDLVTVHVLEITPGLAPTVSLLSPAQQVLVTGQADPFGLGDGEARLSFRLTDAGVHSLLVSSTTGAAGDFLLRLRGVGPVASTGVAAGAPATADVLPGSGPQVFSVSANPGAILPVRVQTSSSEFGFGVQVRDPLGQLVAALAGDDTAPAVLLLPPGQGVYDLVVRGQMPGAAGTVTVSVGALLPANVAAAASQPASPVVTATTETATGAANGVGPVCRVRSAVNVNMRLSPGLTAPVVGTLTANTEQPAAGISADGQWLALDVNGQVVWVALEVVTANGPCSQLPVIQPAQQPPVQGETATAGVTSTSTPPPTQQGAPASPTSTPTQGQAQPTYTYTPSYTPTVMQPTMTYTPSYTPTTPPSAQVAPADANFNDPLNIPLDSTASTTDFVSYPAGDTEDRVRWDISGMNTNAAFSGGRARLIISVSCFGTGTDQIQFFTGGQTYSCGQTIVDREVTYDSRTGQVTITAVGGENTYAQWVLTGSATRID